MTRYFLGADLGATNTRIVITDGDGQALGFGRSGPGNHEVVGYAGFQANLQQAVGRALASAGLQADQISGAGFGIAGYDWPPQAEPIQQVIRSLHLSGPFELVNDVELGLLAGSERGWGVALVSGTGCNCRGWDASRTRRGQVTGGGAMYGEFAGASELIWMAMRAVAYEWTGRGPATRLSAALVERYAVQDLEQLLQDSMCQKIEINAADAPLVFQVAAEGDPVALELIRWAGRELGAMALTVIRQLGFEGLEFDLVQIGSLFEGSPLLTEELKAVVHVAAPAARFIRLAAPPIMGAVLLGMSAAGLQPGKALRERLTASLRAGG